MFAPSRVRVPLSSRHLAPLLRSLGARHTMPAKVALALDWTPNTNHAGFYVAKAQGLYEKAGLDVTFISPHSDEYKVTPASRVESGEALLAIAPSESVISYATWPEAHKQRPKLRAVAAVLQADTSAIATLKSSGIDRPAKLDGKRYASYAARFEGRIVQQMIKADGGSGEYTELAPPMLGIWETLLKGEADATWIFTAWEGVEARRKGVELNTFRLGDYGIPYGHSPVLLAHPDSLSGERSAGLRAFLAASAEGFKYAAAHPAEAAALFVKQATADHGALPTPLDGEMCAESLSELAKHLLAADGRWGVQDAGRWNAFLDWLSEHGLLTTKVQSREAQPGVTTTLDGLRGGDAGERIPRESVAAADLFTNDLLP